MWTALAVIALLPPGLQIRHAQVDITPSESLPLGGYTARQGGLSVPGGDRLYARTVILSEGSTCVAVVSAEMLTIPDSLVREVKSRIPKRVALFLAATHTHSAPDSQMLNDRMTFAIPGVATFRKRWLTWYAERIATCVIQALGSPAESPKSVVATVLHVALNHGRRVGALPDQAATDVAANEPGPGAGTEEKTNLFFSYAAHPVFYDEHEMHTRGDWPGVFMAERRTIVLLGALGDVSPRANGSTPAEKIMDFVRTISGAEASGKSHAQTVWTTGGAVQAVSSAITMDAPVASPAFITDYKLPQALADTLVKRFSPPTASVTAFRIGSLAVVGIPGEPMSHLGRRIRDYGHGLGFSNVIVVSHVNGWIGYILDPADYGRGGYEASLSLNGPQEGEQVVKAAKRALQDLSRQLSAR